MWKGIPVGKNTWLDLIIGVFLVCFGTFFAVQALTLSVVLTDESITVGSVFRKQSLHLEDIRYRREYEEYQDAVDGGINVYYLELVARDGEHESIRIAKDDFDFDRDFWEWVSRIRDFEHL
jgi:hypothetical protein